MTADSTPREPAALSRDERRRRTENAILDAARQLFAEDGYERVTIRGVASQAGIDPALVMQYYGSKEQLFAAAARWSADSARVMSAAPADVPAAALADMFERFERSDDRESAIALMRNCLTHPMATEVVRDEVMCERASAVADHLDGDDAELRAALIGACMMGLSMSRYLIAMPPVASASQADIERLFAPVLRALAEPPE